VRTCEQRLQAVAEQCAGVMTDGVRSAPCSTLDDKTDALVRVGALVALGASPRSYDATIRAAIAAGATTGEVVDTLVAVSTTVGLARVVAASPDLARALGYDLDAAFEAPTTSEG
jgi:alkylhydroperoxidase/carboxymuconolactone decarboxylase family protein YurZ